MILSTPSDVVNTVTPRKLALCFSINQHLLNNQLFTQSQKEVYIKRFNFPLTLLTWRNINEKVVLSTACMLPQATAIKLADEGKHRFTEYTNSVYHYYMLY